MGAAIVTYLKMFKHEFSFSQIKTAFSDLAIECHGSPEQKFVGVSSAESPQEHSLIFCTKSNFIEAGLRSKAGGIVVLQKDFAETCRRAQDKLIISSPNPELLMASLVDRFILSTPYRDFENSEITGQHPTAVVDASAHIHSTAFIGPGVVIGRQVKIAAHAYVGANSVVESHSEIGERSTIQPLVFIGSRVKIGSRCEISAHSSIGKEGFGYAHDLIGNHVRIPHQGWVIIEDDVHIGANNTIDRGTFGETRIGRGTKTDNQVHIAHNCKVGKGCLLTSGLKMAGSSSLGNFVITGGNTLIGGHLHVTDGVNLAAQSAVSKSIDIKGDYGGSPLLPVQQFLKMKSTMTQLPEMRRQIRKLMGKIFPDEV